MSWRRTLSKRYPFDYGKKRVFQNLLGFDVRHIPDGMPLKMRDGRTLRVRASKPYWSVYFFEEHEPVETVLIRELLQPGDVFVDVGANYGWFATLAARRVGEQGRVIAFEPLPKVFEELEWNIGANQASNYSDLVNVAVGDKEAVIELVWNSNDGDTHASRAGRGDRREHVPQLTLDDYLADNQISSVNFIKCDVEGAESFVIDGARNTLSAEHRPMLLFERQEPGTKGTDKLLETLRSCGYTDFFATYRTLSRTRDKTRKIPSQVRGLIKRGLVGTYDHTSDADPRVRNVLALDSTHLSRLPDFHVPDSHARAAAQGHESTS